MVSMWGQVRRFTLVMMSVGVILSLTFPVGAQFRVAPPPVTPPPIVPVRPMTPLTPSLPNSTLTPLTQPPLPMPQTHIYQPPVAVPARAYMPPTADHGRHNPSTHFPRTNSTRIIPPTNQRPWQKSNQHHSLPHAAHARNTDVKAVTIPPTPKTEKSEDEGDEEQEEEKKEWGLSAPPPWVYYVGAIVAILIMFYLLGEKSQPPAGYVKVTTPPPGEAPDHVRAAWVGMKLPLTPDHQQPAYLPALGLSHPLSDGTYHGFSVKGRTALRLLQVRNPAAARWWVKNVPDITKPEYRLLFPTSCCQRLGS